MKLGTNSWSLMEGNKGNQILRADPGLGHKGGCHKGAGPESTTDALKLEMQAT